MAKTAASGDENRPKKFSEKIKKSPAAKEYREKGAKHVAKKLGSMAADVAAGYANKAAYHLGLTENPSPAHAANAAFKDDRKTHFVSSYTTSRGEIHGECVTCGLNEARG